MTVPINPQNGDPRLRPKVDAGQLWAGGVATAIVAALLATALLYLLLVSTPRPLTFFSWIVGLATVVVVLFPFSTGAPLSEKVATAAVFLVIGFAIGSLLSGVAARSIRRRPVRSDYPAVPRDDRQVTESATEPYPRRRY